MVPSSRTPEGEPKRCPVCGHAVRIDPSRPPGDAPCPHCGHLLWFGKREQRWEQDKLTPRQRDAGGTVDAKQPASDEGELAEQEVRLRRGDFTLDDFRRMLGPTKKLGPIRKILSMVPGMGVLNTSLDLGAAKDIRRLEGIIDAMTAEERKHPRVIDDTRCQRIAEGAGVEPYEVRELVTQFAGMAAVMQKMAGMGLRERMRFIQTLPSEFWRRRGGY
mgnify:FL=1